MDVDRPNRRLRVLWLGPWHSDIALYGRRAVNQAATMWSRGLLKGLLDTGCELRVATHCREQYWPVGELLPGRTADFDNVCPVCATRYLNLPMVRDAWLSMAYRRMVAHEVASRRPDVVLTYNLAPYHCAVTEILAGARVKWIPIVLDQADPEPDDWRTFSAQARGASGLVFLSHWGFRHCPVEVPLLHMDGGIDVWRGDAAAEASEPLIVYSGKFDDRYGGLDALFAMFAEVHAPGCRFLLTGKDPKGTLAAYLRREPRSEYCGFLDETRLQELHRRAAVFVNPRPPEVRDNRMTFPSKLLNYLAYGKPIVSTWTDGLAPDYRRLLLVPAAARPKDYADLIARAVSWNRERRAKWSRIIREWVVETHMWRQQAEKLVRWATDIVGT